MTISEICKLYKISKEPNILYSSNDNKIYEGHFNPAANTITIYNCADKNKTLEHELSHFVLYNQGKHYIYHTKSFYLLESQIKRHLNDIKRSN